MLESWIESLKVGRCISEKDVRTLCEKAKEILVEESNVQPVSTPVSICGDLHGQLYDLLELFSTGGDIPNTKYIFMGDFVDRGYNSVETFELLLCLKVKYPGHITLLRGNHESRQISYAYGFYEEVMKKYGNANPWKYFTEVFDYLGIAALVEGKVLCVHGGISPEATTLDMIRLIDRRVEIPTGGAFCDMMWSDPEDIETWSMSPRGAGWLFGSRVTKEFNHINGLDLIARAHQLVQEGFKYWFPSKNLVTVWSAPNYYYRCGNVASIMTLGENLERQFMIFRDSADNCNNKNYKKAVPYFL